MSWLVLGLMLALFVVGMPIVLAMGICSVVYAAFFVEVPLSIVPQQIVSSIDTFLLLAIPMFLLTGGLMGEADVTQRLVRFAQSLLGWIRGGLALVNILTNTMVSGISGSALADAAATGGALIPVMKKAGYPPAFSAAITACGATVGPMMPTSILMVVIGGLTDISIGRMYLGGIVPGLVLAAMLGLVAYFVAVRRHYPIQAQFSLRECFSSFFSALPSFGLPIIIVGGILSGVFTPSEAAGVAAMYVIAHGIAYRTLTWRGFYRGVVEAAVVSGTVIFTLGVAAILSWLLIAENVGANVVDALTGLTDDPKIMLLLIMGALVLLGFVMESLPILFLAVPVLMPLVTTIGIDPVQFGVVAIAAVASGLAHPPLGLTMFLVCDLAKVTMEEYTWQAIPFLICILVALGLFVVFPEIVLWLPNFVMSK